MTISVPADCTAWAVNACSWREANILARDLGIPQVVAMVLAGRGISDPVAAREFLECSFSLHDPFLFSDMQGAVGTLLSGVDAGRKIVVHGDYDADGITATALLVLGLHELGGEVDWFLPSRFREGYGLSRTAVEAVVASGATVLVAVDCGVNYPDEVAFARSAGLEVIVVDHHEPGPRLPDCHLIHHVRGAYPHGELCGVGLALKVMHALHVERRGAARDQLPPGLSGYLDLVAIGTVADLAPLRDENRYYVREGLKLLNLGQREGLRALAQVSSCAGAIDSGTVAFRLAPRLNAAGRLSDPSPPLRLLLTEDPREAARLAAELHELNGARQDLERIIFESAQKQVAALPAMPSVLVLAAADWHEGVVGIVASRMVEQYQRPTVLLGIRDGVAKGSGRSIPGYDLLGGLTACGQLLTIFGGHAQAAGLTLQAEAVDEFRRALLAHAESVLSPSDLVPRYQADAVLTAEELNADTALALGSLEPFGSGNPRPRFMVVDAVLQNAECTRNGLHLRCRAQVGGVKIPAIGFGMGSRTDLTAGEEALLLGAQLKADEWHGSVRAQLVLERVASVPPRPALSGMEQMVCGPGSRGGSKRMAPGGTGGVGWPSDVRDLRGHPGRVTALAQVVGTQERCMLLTASASRTAETVWSRLPLGSMAGGDVVCVNRACQPQETIDTCRLAIVEWEAAPALVDCAKAWSHAIAFDPPFRVEQVQAVAVLRQQGCLVHLLYGEAERKETAALLKYLLHPRYAMVCIYRAMEHCSLGSDESWVAARRIAWEEARVVLADWELERAETVLKGIGLERWSLGKAKLDARQNAAYREAEADYEESVRLCLTL
jgi:single-stranded-DNA-specific exonuclease